jgi:hypothetical protein
MAATLLLVLVDVPVVRVVQVPVVLVVDVSVVLHGLVAAAGAVHMGVRAMRAVLVAVIVVVLFGLPLAMVVVVVVRLIRSGHVEALPLCGFGAAMETMANRAARVVVPRLHASRLVLARDATAHTPIVNRYFVPVRSRFVSPRNATMTTTALRCATPERAVEATPPRGQRRRRAVHRGDAPRDGGDDRGRRELQNLDGRAGRGAF